MTGIRREIGAAGSLRLRRLYDAAIDDVWKACTEPERLGRWLGPVDGDLRVGGTFRLHDDAAGEILRRPGTWGTVW